MGQTRAAGLVFAICTALAAPAAGAVVISTDRYVERGNRYVPYDPARANEEYRTGVQQIQGPASEPWSYNAGNLFWNQASNVGVDAFSFAGAASQGVWQQGISGATWIYSKSMYEVVFDVTEPTPFVLNTLDPPLPAGTLTLTGPSAIVQTYNADGNFTYAGTLTPGQWKFNAVCDPTIGTVVMRDRGLNATLTVPEPSCAAAASCGIALVMRCRRPRLQASP